eukprot:RCo019118
MALQYSEDGAVCTLVFQQESGNRRSAALENFVGSFAVRFGLKGIPDGEAFCPIRTTAVVLACLKQVTQSLPLMLLRVRNLLSKTRRVQTWIRRVLRARDEHIQQIFDRWVANDSSNKKSIRTELYRNSKMRPAAVRLRLRTYAMFHNTEDAMQAAVVALYWERRGEFRRQVRFWSAQV